MLLPLFLKHNIGLEGDAVDVDVRGLAALGGIQHLEPIQYLHEGRLVVPYAKHTALSTLLAEGLDVE